MVNQNALILNSDSRILPQNRLKGLEFEGVSPPPVPIRVRLHRRTAGVNGGQAISSAVFPDHERMIVHRILCPIDERHDAPLVQFLLQAQNLLTVFVEFGVVPFPELLPSMGVMSEPFPEFRAGGKVLEPQIDAGFFFAQTPWPEPVHENAPPVLSVRRFIDPFDSEVHDLSGFRPGKEPGFRLPKICQRGNAHRGNLDKSSPP